MEVIADFKGIKRRFEKRLEGDITVMDCHAPTAEKAASVLANIREVYHAKIIVVYEPNIGGRQRSSSRMYDGAFKDADTVIIPHLTKLKVADDGSETPLEGDELAATIKKTYAEVQYIEDDATLVASLKQQAQKGDIIVFMGSHGFRGMIEETVKVLQ
jgi:UDP-N-acetylmuramate-alanine ligase